MMLEELFKNGYIDYKKLLLDYSKVLGLGADEAFVLTKILDNYLIHKTLSVDTLQDQILMTSTKMDKVVANLMERGYYEIYLAYDHGVGKECISFRPLFEKLEAIIDQGVDMSMYDIEKANQYISSKMNRVLTASELEILQSIMIEDHYTLQNIIVAVDKIVSEKRVLSMRTITMMLSKVGQDITPKQEAPQAFKDFLKKL